MARVTIQPGSREKRHAILARKRSISDVRDAV
jgi:hypothetical protein